jgi:hypothetical protein
MGMLDGVLLGPIVTGLTGGRVGFEVVVEIGVDGAGLLGDFDGGDIREDDEGP